MLCFYTNLVFGSFIGIIVLIMMKSTMFMSQEIYDFSEMIDEQFEIIEKPVSGFFNFLISLFN